MAILTQQKLIAWNEIDNLGDLERLRLVIDHICDEKLMQKLERDRGRQCNNRHPVRGVWNSILAGIVFQHNSIESLRRELKRNPLMRDLCGLKDVPSPPAYTRFLKSLLRNSDLIDEMFHNLVELLREVLEDFGGRLAIDSKAIKSHARGRKKDAPLLAPDGRRDIDANWGKKEKKGKREDGSAWSKVTSWFGYKLHLIVDADYEIPVAFSITKASVNDHPAGRELVRSLAANHPQLMDNAWVMSADKGYDSEEFNRMLWDDYDIKPVIAIRNTWRKNDDETRLLDGTENVVYNYRGDIQCCCMETGEMRNMPNGGFDKSRNCLKYICPVSGYGVACKYHGRCKIGNQIRIKIDEDRRLFTPLARSSYKWDREYKKRTSVERVNSRVAAGYGFDNHFIRGQKKMEMRMGLSLIVMLSMSLGHAREGRPEKIRSLVRCA